MQFFLCVCARCSAWIFFEKFALHEFFSYWRDSKRDFYREKYLEILPQIVDSSQCQHETSTIVSVV